MPKYEYKNVSIVGAKELNELGQQGWRLVSTHSGPGGSGGIMEREIPDHPEQQQSRPKIPSIER